MPLPSLAAITDKIPSFFKRSLSSSTDSGHIINTYKPTKISLSKTLLESGRFKSRLEFIFLAISYSISPANIIIFPLLILSMGGFTFLLPYVFGIILIAIPTLLMSFSIGQFTSKSCINSFQCVPIFSGLGWSTIIISCLLTLINSSIIAKSIFYIYLHLLYSAPFFNCSFINSSKKEERCISPTDKCDNSMNKKDTVIKLFSTFQFHKMFSSKYEFYLGGSYVLFSWKMLLILLGIWIIVTTYAIPIYKSLIFVKYIFMLLPFAILLGLTFSLVTSKGFLLGMKLLWTPKLNDMVNLTNYPVAFNFIFFSMNLGNGMLINLGNYNHFHYNYSHDPIIICITGLVFSFLIGLFTFNMLGEIEYQCKNFLHNRFIYHSDIDFFFTTLLFGIGHFDHFNWYVILTIVSIILLSLANMVIDISNIYIIVIDYYPKINDAFYWKILLAILSCITFFILNILFAISNAYMLFYYLIAFIYPLLSFTNSLHFIIWVYFYGISNIRSDIKMMLGFNLNVFWTTIMTILTPIVSLLVFIDISYDITYFINKKYVRTGVIIISIVALIIPIFGIMIYRIICYFYRNPYHLTPKEMFFEPTKFWGPYYKRYWLLNHRYRKKLATFRNDKDFRKQMPPDEDLDEIIDTLTEILKEAIIEYKRKEKKYNHNVSKRKQKRHEQRSLELSESLSILSELDEEIKNKSDMSTLGNSDRKKLFVQKRATYPSKDTLESLSIDVSSKDSDDANAAAKPKKDLVHISNKRTHLF